MIYVVHIYQLNIDIRRALVGQKAALGVIVEICKDAPDGEAVHEAECFQGGCADVEDRLSLWKGNIASVRLEEMEGVRILWRDLEHVIVVRCSWGSIFF